eukprot:jgi/Astpho2/7086/Aster-x1407
MYTATVVLDSSDGPHRSIESGMVQQLVLVTFAIPLEFGAEPLPPRLQACCHDIDIADHRFRIFVAGRQVSVALVTRALQEHQKRLLSADARPFVSHTLRSLFNTLPTGLQVLPKPTRAIFGSWWHPSAEEDPNPAAVHLGLAPRIERAEDALQTEDKQLQQQVSVLLKMSRLLMLEESTYEQDVSRHDLFNQRLQFAFVQPSPRAYLVSKDWHLLGLKDGPGFQPTGSEPGLRRFIYRGPLLQALFPAESVLVTRQVLVLEVPGLPEGRPTLVLGDNVFLRLVAELDTEWAGVVVATEQTRCLVAMPHAFWEKQQSDFAAANSDARTPPHTSPRGSAASSPGQGLSAPGGEPPKSSSPVLNVRHANNSANWRRCPEPKSAADHHSFSADHGDEGAEAGAETGADVEAGEGQPRAKAGGRLAWSDVQQKARAMTELGQQHLNEEQKVAVASMLLGVAGARPFALNGPPGTGKTVTLVEMGLQVLQQEGVRLLMCAPKNFSADLLCSALGQAGITKKAMLRLNDPRHPPPQVKSDVLGYCNLDTELGCFQLPQPDVLAGYRVIISTCAAAGLLRGIAYDSTNTPLEFTHMLIDEAGEALPPETLIPMTLAGPEARVVLCGDPRQLGPAVRSGDCQAHGLATSLLEGV